MPSWDLGLSPCHFLAQMVEVSGGIGTASHAHTHTHTHTHTEAPLSPLFVFSGRLDDQQCC